MTQKFYNDLTYRIIGAAIEVHKELGPGLLENIYERCLIHLLRKSGLRVESQQRVPVIFQGLHLDCELRLDLLVEDCIIVEVKAADRILPIFEAKLLTYLRLLKKPKGIILNFNSSNLFKDGQKTMVTAQFGELPRGYD